MSASGVTGSMSRSSTRSCSKTRCQNNHSRTPPDGSTTDAGAAIYASATAYVPATTVCLNTTTWLLTDATTNAHNNPVNVQPLQFENFDAIKGEYWVIVI